jgi:hypothetical protein
MDGVASMPESMKVTALERWFPKFVVVVEGAANAIEGDGEHAAVRVVRARGLGDDEIVRQAAETGGPCLVVTADRELRTRCEAVGAAVTGPRWLLDRV